MITWLSVHLDVIADLAQFVVCRTSCTLLVVIALNGKRGGSS